MVVYAIAKEFSISPLEVYDMPKELVQDMLIMMEVSAELQEEAIERQKREYPTKLR